MGPNYRYEKFFQMAVLMSLRFYFVPLRRRVPNDTTSRQTVKILPIVRGNYVSIALLGQNLSLKSRCRQGLLTLPNGVYYSLLLKELVEQNNLSNANLSVL